MELSYGGESIRRGSVIRSGGGDRRGRDENHWTGSGLSKHFISGMWVATAARHASTPQTLILS